MIICKTLNKEHVSPLPTYSRTLDRIIRGLHALFQAAMMTRASHSMFAYSVLLNCNRRSAVGGCDLWYEQSHGEVEPGNINSKNYRNEKILLRYNFLFCFYFL